MNLTIAQHKAASRAAIAKTLAALSDREIHDEALLLVSNLKEWVPLHRFEVVLATLPLAREPDLSAFLAWWLSSGRRVAMARTGKQLSMEFRQVNSLAGPWETKPSGLREPPITAPLWEPGPKTLALVPGLAFAQGQTGVSRLGRGAGYYDRWLAVHRSFVFSLGVALSAQIVENLPEDWHDQRLDGWISAVGVNAPGIAG